MGTGTILLTIPPGGMDATNPPGLLFENNQWHLVFDDTTDEICYWSFRCPENFASDFVLKVRYKMDTATTLEVIMRCAIRATADGQDPSVETFDTENTSAATTVPGTAEFVDEISLALTNDDAVAAGESMTVRLARDANNAGDDATGDMKVLGVALEYTTG